MRLRLKSWRFRRQLPIDDPRIALHVGFWPPAQLLEFLQQLDACVLPSRGEGFGLCGLEAMATGFPTIATNWSGPVEYLDPSDSFPLAYRLVDAGGTESNMMRYSGQWAEPDYAHALPLTLDLRASCGSGRPARATGRSPCASWLDLGAGRSADAG